MTKKLIALVEVLMVISLLCTGYASWIITDPRAQNLGSVQSNATVYNVVDLQSLTAYGIAFSTEQGESFRYSTISTSGSATPTYKLTNTTLMVPLEVNDSVMNGWLDGTNTDYRMAAVAIKCTDAGGKHFSGSATACKEIGLLPPSHAKLVVEGYPNLSITTPVTLESDGSMTLRIPVEQIYNLAKLDKINATATVLQLQLEFTDSIPVSSNGFINSVVKHVKPSYTAYIVAS